ncbi:MAG: insulinase family protein [Candidatus Omnitrophica bacterium]|nr:insulinase family protein [Candidatus Omnitrophota bacterium]
MVELSALPNGIRVVTAPLKERKSAALGLWVHTGGRDEEPSKSGISHFLEHLVFKGTKTRSADQIKEAVEGVGGSLNAFTSEEYTCFLAKSSQEYFEKVFGVLSDMVLNAALRKRDLEKERTVIMEEIKMTQDQPSQYVDELLTELLWPGHALGRPLAGTLETVGGLTQENLKSYRDDHYQPDFITVAASGALSHRRVLRAAGSHFIKKASQRQKTASLFKNRQTEPRLKWFHKKTEQTHLALGIHSFPKDHEDVYALDILSVLLGGNMSSRLFNEVREKRGLAYEIGTAVRKFQETGAFIVGAGIDNRKVHEAVKVILKELRRTTRELVGKEELKRTKEFYLGQLDLALENSLDRMLWVGDSLVTLGRIRAPREVARRVGKVTAEDIRRVARKIFETRSLNLAAIGPLDDKKARRFKELLSF